MTDMTHFKTIFLAALIFASTGFGGAAVQAKQADTKAQSDLNTQIAVAQASKAWKDAFNSGDAAAAAALYEENAIMVVIPFGTFEGRDAILAFWTNLVNKGFDDVVYSNTVTTLLGDRSARVAAD